jgi:hypothetical protein
VQARSIVGHVCKVKKDVVCCRREAEKRRRNENINLAQGWAGAYCYEEAGARYSF